MRTKGISTSLTFRQEVTKNQSCSLKQSKTGYFKPHKIRPAIIHKIQDTAVWFQSTFWKRLVPCCSLAYRKFLTQPRASSYFHCCLCFDWEWWIQLPCLAPIPSQPKWACTSKEATLLKKTREHDNWASLQLATQLRLLIVRNNDM